MNNLKELIQTTEAKRENIKRGRDLFGTLQKGDAVILTGPNTGARLQVSGENMQPFLDTLAEYIQKLEAELKPMEEKLRLLNELLGDANQ